MRADLGGWATNIPALSGLDVAVEKPVVVLYGPNGSGKTTLLRMLRAATGLVGERQGWEQSRVKPYGYDTDPAACGGDPGKLAAWCSVGTVMERRYGMPRDLPGVLDVEALGWHGHRTWLYDSRKATEGLGASQVSDIETGRHVAQLFDSRSQSHGETLRGDWHEAILWARGDVSAPDPYDGELSGKDACMGVLRDALFPSGRPEERWLLLDEPETTLDAEALAVGLAWLVDKAEIGKLRVFVASHSFLFPAGLASHPKVQVVDLGQGGRWLENSREALRIAADPSAVGKVAADLDAAFEESARRAEAAARAADRKLVARLGAVQRAALVEALSVDGRRLPERVADGRKLSEAALDGLGDKDLVDLRRGRGFARYGVLTAEGERIARMIAAA
jgi:energy-coupling factor transporter ATP-binding protein EcfA2